jgi:hypothetical protein
MADSGTIMLFSRHSDLLFGSVTLTGAGDHPLCCYRESANNGLRGVGSGVDPRRYARLMSNRTGGGLLITDPAAGG